MNREATLKKAEQLLRDGKIDPAIEEYVRLVEQYPRDWGTINALGDLYVRTGRHTLAIAQFTRVADYLFDEGFLPKAQAVYKKTLRVHGGHRHTLERLAEIATRQGLLADAKHYQRQLGQLAQPNAPALAEQTVSPAAAAAAHATIGPVAPVEASPAGSPVPAKAIAAEEPARSSDVHAAPLPSALETEDGVMEFDLSTALDELEAEPAVAAHAGADAEVPPPATRPQSLESVFAEMRTAATFEQMDTTASARYDLALRHLNASRWEEAIVELEAAARAPVMRFQAGSRLGRVLLSRGLIQQGIDWLERAIEAPAPDDLARAALMYELADALEQIDEAARALAILLELDAEVPMFRDVAERIERLKRVIGGS